jgi:hypothetical protein
MISGQLDEQVKRNVALGNVSFHQDADKVHLALYYRQGCYLGTGLGCGCYSFVNRAM